MYCLTAMLSIISQSCYYTSYTCTLTRTYMNIFAAQPSVPMRLSLPWAYGFCVDEHFYQCHRITHIHHRLGMHLIMTFYSNGTYVWCWCIYVYYIFHTIPYHSTYIIHLMRINAYLYSQPFFIHQLIRICQHKNSFMTFIRILFGGEKLLRISEKFRMCTVARKSIESHLIVPRIIVG